MNEKDIKVLLDFQHFAANRRLEALIRAAHEADNEEDDRISIMTDSQTEMLAAAGVDSDSNQPKNRKSLIQFLGGLMVLLSICFVTGCSNITETKYIDQTEIKTTEYTAANATEVAYYTQRYFTDKNGDKYVDEKGESYVYAGSEKKVVNAGTKIATIGNIEALQPVDGINYKCYEPYGFSQSGKTLNLFYKAKKVKYRFFLMPDDEIPVATLEGKSELPLTPPPTNNYNSNGKFALWKGDDGSLLQRTYGTKSMDFYAQWFTPYGNKERPDTVGDIVFSDGTATHYDGASLTGDQIKNAIAVIISSTYNRTTGNGSGYNEGRILIGLGTVMSPSLQWGTKWSKATPFDLDGSKNDGRMNTAIILAKDEEHIKDDEHKFDNFPALKWALNYADYVIKQKDIIISEELKEGWYLPSYNEWMQAFIGRSQTTTAFAVAGAPFDILQDSFWTSTSIMGKKDDTVGWYVYLTPKELKYPNEENTALAMREFK